MQSLTENKIRKRVMGFYQAYYDELRRQVDRYPTVAGSFPEFLTGSKRVEAIMGKDGLVVSHWKSDRDSFEFKRRARTVAGIISDLSGGRVKFDYPPGTEMDVTIAEVKLYDENNLDRPSDPDREPIWRSPWHRLDISGEFNADRWSEEVARKKAVTDVQVHLTARLLNLPEPSLVGVMQALESATLGFIDMLQEKSPTLEDVRRYLRTDPVLLAPTAARVLPETRLGGDCAPDFVAELADRKCVLIKLAEPSHSLSDQNGGPSKELTAARREVEGWSDWVREHLDETREVLPGIDEFECRLIIGRRSSVGGELADELALVNAGGRISIHTYDDLLDTVTSYLDDLLELIEGASPKEDRQVLGGHRFPLN